MALNLKMEGQLKDPRQKRLAIIAAVVFVGAGILYWQLFFTTPSVPEAGTSKNVAAPVSQKIPGEKGVSEESLKRVRLDTDIIKTPLFEELRLYGDFPIIIPEKGNPKPFSKPK